MKMTDKIIESSAFRLYGAAMEVFIEETAERCDWDVNKAVCECIKAALINATKNGGEHDLEFLRRQVAWRIADYLFEHPEFVEPVMRRYRVLDNNAKEGDYSPSSSV